MNKVRSNGLSVALATFAVAALLAFNPAAWAGKFGSSSSFSSRSYSSSSYRSYSRPSSSTRSHFSSSPSTNFAAKAPAPSASGKAMYAATAGAAAAGTLSASHEAESAHTTVNVASPTYHAWEQPNTGSAYSSRPYAASPAPIIVNNNSGGSSGGSFLMGWLLGHESSPHETVVVPQGAAQYAPGQYAPAQAGSMATVNCSAPGASSANCAGFPSAGPDASAKAPATQASFSGLPIEQTPKPKRESHVFAYIVAGTLIVLLSGLGLFLWRWQTLRTNATPENHYRL